MTRKTIALVWLAALAGTVAQAETVREGLVLDRVTVIDVRTGKLLRNRAVVIAGGKIVKVAAAGSVTAADAAQRVDGAGRFVVPGYNDMHAHNLNTASPETSLPLMLASGVTGFRQMAPALPSGKPPLPADSPALLAMPGTLLAGPAFAQPAAVIAEVARQKTAGVDFIKVVDLPAPAFIAAADAARANGLPYAGHLPPSVDARDAMAHGMVAIEHLGPGISVLLSCSRDEAAIRAMIASAPPVRAPVDFSLPPAQLARALANPNLLNSPAVFALFRRVIATYDEAKCRAFAADVAKSGTWMVPTLTRLEAMDLGNDSALRDNPDLRDVPPVVRTMWRDVGTDFDAKLSPEQKQVLADLFARQSALAKLFDASGVKMLTGTDFGGQWIAPGSSLHREFDLLARAGLPPLSILRMTTLDPAHFLHREAQMGAVEAGKVADLVLLDADPTASAANLHRVVAVVRAGRYLDRAALDAIAARARQALN